LGDIQDTASAVQAGPKIARLLDLSRREAVILQAQLDAGLGLSSHGRDAALERARRVGAGKGQCRLVESALGGLSRIMA
jgi:hypothetical protein